MQTTLVATMLQSHMRPDVGQLSVELAVSVFHHLNVCSDVNMSLSRCWWLIIVDNDIYKEMYTAHEEYTCSGYVTASYGSRPDEGTVGFNNG